MNRRKKDGLIALVVAVLMAVASYFGMPQAVIKPLVDTTVEVVVDLALPTDVTPVNAPVAVTEG